VLRPIEPNEPILNAKITGSGENASLSRIIAPGNRAVTVRVNDVAGVAGFIQPGDRVDVVVTREVSLPAGSGEKAGRRQRSTVADLLLQGVRVLTIDQYADERSDGPQVAKAVTLELNSLDAQKVALASSVGDLSLLLRSAGDQSRDISRSLDLSELIGGRKPQIVAQAPTLPAAVNPVVSNVSLVVIRRPEKSEEYKVPREATQ
jgi:pilus assembly protein CpaB